MLSAIRQSDQMKVLACEESKSNRPFFCSRCRDEAILKQGPIKIPHFSHKPPVTCEYGRGESEKHRQCKMAIYNGLKEQRRFREVEIEKNLGTVRPDVSALMDRVHNNKNWNGHGSDYARRASSSLRRTFSGEFCFDSLIYFSFVAFIISI
jgi:hypothetical protein